ncbi:MAG: DinB family protein [Caldilinea sp. CFX5]|nr:DinB family protein [Caldilinea sp. CFX5]
MKLSVMFAHWEQVRRDLLATIDKFSDDELAYTPYAGAWPAGQIVLHIADCEDNWLHAVVRREFTPWLFYEFKEYPTKAVIKEVLQHAHQGVEVAVELAQGQRRVQGHGHDAGPHRGEEGGHEVFAVGHHHRQAVALLEAVLAQVRGAAHRFLAQPLEAEELLLLVAVEEGEALVGPALGLVQRGDEVRVVEDLRHERPLQEAVERGW